MKNIKKWVLMASLIVFAVLVMGAESITNLIGFIPYFGIFFVVFFTWYKCGVIDTTIFKELKEYWKEIRNKK
jgi:hypothetical protein